MINLERGFLAIKSSQYDLLKAGKEAVRNTCRHVGISERTFQMLLNNAKFNPVFLAQVGSAYADYALMQALAIMSYVALNSDTGIDKQIGELRIGIRCSDNPNDIHESCYIDVNGMNVFHIYQDFNSDYLWTVLYMNPGVVDDDYVLQSVIRAARF